MDEAPGGVEEVYRAEAGRMWRALVGFTGSREIADDAVAEVFARALQDEGSIRDLRAWAWTVSFRLAALELRERRPAVDASAQPLEEPSSSVPDLVRALRQLPQNQRLALVLHDYADRPTPEVASVLGCSRATVHVHLSRGRRRLRELLEERDA